MLSDSTTIASLAIFASLRAVARASDVVRQLTEAIENYEKVAAKATANNDAKRAADALESAEARRSWLAEAQRSLAEFSA